MMEVEQIPADLSAEDKRKYLFLKQINTLNVDVSANKVYDHSRHIGMSADGISQRAVDDTSEVIIEALFHPSGRTQNMTFLAFIIYDDKTNIFFVYSLEDIVEVLTEFLSADAFHCVQGHQISESIILYSPFRTFL